MGSENVDAYISEYSKEYPLKNNLYRAKMFKPPEMDDRSYNPISEAFEQHLLADYEAKGTDEKADEFYKKILVKKPSIVRVVPSPVDQNCLEDHNTVYNSSRTLYQIDYCLPGDYFGGASVPPKKVPMPSKWLPELTTYRLDYRDHNGVAKWPLKPRPVSPPPSSLDPNPIERKILKVTTGRTEYQDVIGSLGGEVIHYGYQGEISRLPGEYVPSSTQNSVVETNGRKYSTWNHFLKMDRFDKALEDNLRKAACEGDVKSVVELIRKGVNVNGKQVINGWTALHWAAKRGRSEVARILLNKGADPNCLTVKGETPLTLASTPEIRQLLHEVDASSSGESPPPHDMNDVDTSGVNDLHITPNYLKNPPLMPSSGGGGSKDDFSLPKCWAPTGGSGPLGRRQPTSSVSDSLDEVVLKIRVANGGDPDFIEIEIPRTELTYYSLLRVCCEELGLNASQVIRIRKLPNTMIRKDKDVARLNQMQELEVVINPSSSKHQPNGYKSIQLYKNQTILY